MNDGKDVYTLMREIRLPPALEIGEGYGKLPGTCARSGRVTPAGSITARRRSSTPVPVCEVYGDVVELAGGPDRLAARAAERVARGEAPAALHLAEMALAAAPDHRGALEAQLAALTRCSKQRRRELLGSRLAPAPDPANARPARAQRVSDLFAADELVDAARRETRLDDLGDPAGAKVSSGCSSPLHARPISMRSVARCCAAGSTAGS